MKNFPSKDTYEANQGSSTFIWQPLLIFVSIECGWMILLLIMNLIGLNIGITRLPIGEDINYYTMIETKGIKGLPNAFWALDSRNPLNPWFWKALLSTENYLKGYELFLISRFVDLLLGFAVFMLLDVITARRCRIYSITSGIAVLIWPFARLDHAVWAFNIGLALSILNLYCYCRYLEGNRQNAHWFASGLLLYFLAIATYTLHLWGILAIPFLTLLSYQKNQEIQKTWHSRLRLGFHDLIWYMSFLIAFILIWDTTSVWSPAAKNLMKVETIAAQLPISIRCLIMSDIDKANLSTVLTMWPVAPTIVAIAILFTLYFGIVYINLHRNKFQPEITTHYPTLSQLLISFAIVAALSAGVLHIESTTPVWLPGTRTPMVQKVVQPCLLIIIVFVAARIIPIKYGYVRMLTLNTCLALICLIGSMLAINNYWEKWGTNQKHTAILTSILDSPQIKTCTYDNLVIIMDKDVGAYIPTYQFRRYMAYKYLPKSKSVTFIKASSNQNRAINYKSVILYEKNIGLALRHRNQINEMTIVPYEKVAFFRYNSTDGICHLPSLQYKDFENTDAHVNNKEWLVQPIYYNKGNP